MTYGRNHTEDDCDKCSKRVGIDKLKKVKFIYLDMNDESHEDISEQYGYPKGMGYRQYYVCKRCDKRGV